MRPPPILPPPQAPLRPRRRKRRSLLLMILGFIFASGVVLFLAGSAVAGYLIWRASQDLPSYESLAKYEPPVMTRIHAHDGSLISEFSRERRIFVPINTIPKRVIHAFLSAEDRRFYEHGGIDFKGVARAIIKNIQNYGRRRPEGASTITQQVAKNLLLSAKQDLDRKIREAILAIRIERAYSKEKILELYLNEIYLGLGAYGVAGAALSYFNKELHDLTIEEVAYLAALPKAPNNYHPFTKQAAALERRNWIIGEMAKNGFITDQEAREARAKPLTVNIRPFGTRVFGADYFAEEVRRTLVGMYGEDGLLGRLERIGAAGSGENRVNGGLSVRTTLDPKMQAMARKALVDGLVSFDRQHTGWRGPVSQIETSGDWGVALGQMDVPSDITPWRLSVVLEVGPRTAQVGLRPSRKQDGSLVEERLLVNLPLDEMKWAKVGPKKAADPRTVSEVLKVGDVVWVAPKDPTNLQGVWSLMQIPEVGGGIVVMDPHTGRVHAAVGGFSFALSQYDRATQAKRQPGSSFKPFVYAAAMENGYKPTSIVLDAPISIEGGKGSDVWEPQNYGGKFYGPSTLRLGIEKSRNLMTVRLAQDMGMPLVIEYARRFGIYDDLLPVLSMSLGAGETTLLKMTTAYAMLANGGKRVRATFLDRIQDRWGRTIWRHDERECTGCRAESWQGQAEPEVADDRQQVIDPHTAYQITSMMEGVIRRGTATILRMFIPEGMDVAGKTGTTNDSKDVWFIGYTADLAVGVFVGYDQPRPMGQLATGGGVAAPIFGNFMKMALADRKAVPFRRPAGLRQMWVSLKTGLRVNPGTAESVQEAFKPNEEPDDAYSLVGFSEGSSQFETGTHRPGQKGPATQQQPQAQPPPQQIPVPQQPVPPKRGPGFW